MSLDVGSAATLASRSLADRADPAKAKDMQAYMKTDMPFYGVQKPGRTPVLRRLIADYVPESREREFFIRKAIGWALREYAETDPDAVATFVMAHRNELSGLSYREATKDIGGRVDA